MLNVWFGDGYPFGKVIKRVDMYFDIMKEKSWFNDKFNQEMIKDVDRGTIVLKDYALESPMWGGMSPDKLSGGLKTLILVKELPNITFDITNCGENCFKWLFKICENEDRTVVLKYHPLIAFLDPFKMKIINNDKIVTNAGDMSSETMEFIFEDENSERMKEIRYLEDKRAKEVIKELKEKGII